MWIRESETKQIKITQNLFFTSQDIYPTDKYNSITDFDFKTLVLAK